MLNTTCHRDHLKYFWSTNLYVNKIKILIKEIVLKLRKHTKKTLVNYCLQADDITWFNKMKGKIRYVDVLY